MNLQIGVKEVYTKNVTQTHNYKENIFFLLFLQLQLLKKKNPMYRKKGMVARQKQMYSLTTGFQWGVWKWRARTVSLS